MVALENEFGRLRTKGISSYLYVWWNFPVKSSGPGLLFASRFFKITNPISVLVINLFKLPVFSLYSVSRLYVFQHLHIFSMLSNLLAYNYSQNSFFFFCYLCGIDCYFSSFISFLCPVPFLLDESS